MLVSGGVNSKASQIKLSAAPSVALAFVPGSHGKDPPTNPQNWLQQEKNSGSQRLLQ